MNPLFKTTSRLGALCGLGALLAAQSSLCQAQTSGNAGSYASRGEGEAARNESSKRLPTPAELVPDNKATFIEASVLMNVLADEYVAVFGVAEEGATLAAASAKMEATLAAFRQETSALGVAEKDVFVDFVTQNKIYAYQFEGNIAKEQVAGFEIKKNVMVHYKDKALLDRLTLAAAKVQVFDLVKVDYVVSDIGSVQEKLRAEAAQIVRAKAALQRVSLGIALSEAAQVVADKPSVYYPVEQYDAYSAAEGESLRGSYDRSKYIVQEARKSRTSYFNPLGSDGFDKVINPVVTEPVVQCTMYLKVRYEPGKTKRK